MKLQSLPSLPGSHNAPRYCVTVFLGLVVAWTGAAGQTATAPQAVQERQTQIGTQRQGSTEQQNTRQEAADRLLGQIWGLSAEEIARAKVLLQGPRASFSVANLSPIEALGIHARNEAERRKYAEMFAKSVRADVERSLAWQRAFSEAMRRIYGVEPLLDFSGQERVTASVGAADAFNVPRDLVIEQTPSAARQGTKKASR